MRLYSRAGKLILSGLGASVLLTLTAPAAASEVTVTIKGSDAIVLAGRTDLVIPPANSPWPGGLIRHGFPTPEEIQETLPPFIPVSGGDVIRAAAPAVGGVSFFNGFGGIVFSPSGSGLSGSNLSSFGGISGYRGPQGPLTGVFLGDSIPLAGPPPTLDFSPGGLGIDFLTLSPGLGQVFYIGDGIAGGGAVQEFIAPAGATRLFLGIPDGFGFIGAPGAYDDNDGSYRISMLTSDCDPERIDNPLPIPSVKKGNGWRMTVDVSENDGLVLEDVVLENVVLGDRYMAKKISVPFLTLETTFLSPLRLALRTHSSGPGASRLIGFREIQPAGEFDPFVLEATYLITNISPQGKSCLRVIQRYEFFKAIDEETEPDPKRHCEPSQITPDWEGRIVAFLSPGLICGRLNPIIKYTFFAQEGESLVSLNIPGRFHFQVDGDTHATHLLIRDHEDLTLGFLPFPKPFDIIPAREDNPLRTEIIQTPILFGSPVLDTADNYHQSHSKPLGEKIKEPYLLPPGCPECVHTHWRWGTHLEFPKDVQPGEPIIPAGSTQTVQYAVVRARPEEEHPAGTLADLVNGESVVNTDNVFWYSPTGHQPSDSFFLHGIFFSPDPFREPLSSLAQVVIRFPDDADPGTTTFTPIDPAIAGVLPPGFSVFQNTAVDISASGSTGTGPILVAVLVSGLDDPAVFARLRVFHREGDTLVDQTIRSPDTPAPDFEHRTLFARVDSLSPFVLALAAESLPTNRPPNANAGPDQAVACTTPTSTSVTLNGSGSTDPDGDSLAFTWLDATGQELGNRAIVNLTLPLGTHTVTLVASDGKGGISRDEVLIRVVDTTPPTIASLTATPDVLPVRKRELVDVRLTAVVTDVCDAAPTCRLVAVSSNEPVAGLSRHDKEPDWVVTGPLTVKLRGERSGESSGRVYTLTVQCADAANNRVTKTLTVFVPPPGRMKGEGRVEADGVRFDFDFHVKETVKGKDGGKLELKVRAIKTPNDRDVKEEKRDRGRADRFETTRITEVVFTDDPDLMPGGHRTKADTVVFQGRGRWNGNEGYSFEASATDAGEPGVGRDSFAITIRNRNGDIVASANGLLTHGNNQAKRPKR